MKTNLKEFFTSDYKFEYNINIGPDCNFDEILIYHMKLYYFGDNADIISGIKMIKYEAADIYSYIFNSCEVIELLDMVDSISADVVYVVERFYEYSSNIIRMGSMVVMDCLDLKIKELEYDKKLKLYIKLLEQLCEVSRKIGVSDILLMSKAIQLEATELERKK